MKLFLDTAEIEQVRKWLPIIDGVTTNPSILEKQGGDLKELAKLIFPCPLSIEACGNFVSDAGYWANIIPNAVIKIPLLNPCGDDNIKIIHQLTQEGIEINCTALMSLSQIILAEKAGARYVSLFAGRVDDEGGDPYSMIADCMDYLDNTDCELIVGSIRTVGNVLEAVRAGADIVTIPPPILEKMAKHSNSLRTVNEFEEASRRIS